MKTIAAISLAILLSGCAGLTSAWRLQIDMRYSTPEVSEPPPALPTGKPV